MTVTRTSCNARHLALAQKLEHAVDQRLERAPELSENALRNLAVVSEAAQRISRLALGVSTENLHTSQDPYAPMSDEELAQELTRLGIEAAVQYAISYHHSYQFYGIPVDFKAIGAAVQISVYVRVCQKDFRWAKAQDASAATVHCGHD